jgi:hypothetical protein
MNFKLELTASVEELDAMKQNFRHFVELLGFSPREGTGGGLKHGKHKHRRFRGIIVIRPLEPIKKKDIIMDPINLGQIPLGMRLPVDIVPDEEVDVKPDGNFASLTVIDGDSTAFVAPGGTSKASRLYFNGDGAVGLKGADAAVDGHVGTDDVEIVQHFTWEVVHKDATAFTSTPGKLEPIPTA